MYIYRSRNTVAKLSLMFCTFWIVDICRNLIKTNLQFICFVLEKGFDPNIFSIFLHKFMWVSIINNSKYIFEKVSDFNLGNFHSQSKLSHLQHVLFTVSVCVFGHGASLCIQSFIINRMLSRVTVCCAWFSGWLIDWPVTASIQVMYLL